MAANINVEYINPILQATITVVRDACRLNVAIGKPSLATASFTDDEFLILMGITGEMKGQAIIDFPVEGGKEIASAMCMMPIETLDELAQSAICELCNMILGNSATLYSVAGKAVDITPPTICTGNVVFNANYAANIKIPILKDGARLFDINIAIKGDD